MFKRINNSIIFIGLALSLVFCFYLVFKNSISKYSIPLTTNTNFIDEQKKADIFVPLYLKIPIINVNATVESVGITLDGLMDVPEKPEDVAWFNLGPRPGENGNAVINGHSGWKNNKSAVFDNLHKLKIGDKIYTIDSMGETTIFVVREFRSYNPKAEAEDIFVSNDNKAHLNLITCSGYWNEKDQTHSSRLVVFTDKVEN